MNILNQNRFYKKRGYKGKLQSLKFYNVLNPNDVIYTIQQHFYLFPSQQGYH